MEPNNPQPDAPPNKACPHCGHHRYAHIGLEPVRSCTVSGCGCEFYTHQPDAPAEPPTRMWLPGGFAPRTDGYWWIADHMATEADIEYVRADTLPAQRPTQSQYVPGDFWAKWKEAERAAAPSEYERGLEQSRRDTLEFLKSTIDQLGFEEGTQLTIGHLQAQLGMTKPFSEVQKSLDRRISVKKERE